MIEQEQIIAETEWGLEVVIKDGLTLDNENILPRIKLVIALCNKINKRKVLVDASTINRKISIINMYLGIEEYKKLGGFGHRIAFVAPHLVDHNDSRFAETVGQNKGVFIKYFRDKVTALKWLLK